MLIDTHSHIFLDDFDADREGVVERAGQCGVQTFLHVGIDFESSRKAIALAHKYPHSYASVGLHPHEASRLASMDKKALLELYQDEKVVAIGEIGLDYFRNFSPKKDQIETFRYFLNLQKDLDLPVIIHARDSFDDIVQVIQEELGGVKGVLHCFSGDEKDLEAVLGVGLYVSFAGQVTYKKNDFLRNCAKKVPEDRIVIETDCPYLTPQSKRGKRNEPSYIVETAERIARERGMTLEAFGKVTTENAKKLFNLK